jgi:hypothetical protein
MYRVAWLPSATEELASLWLLASSGLRQAITAATHAVDQILQREPQDFGESREGNVRIGHEEPLGLTFEIDEAEKVDGSPTFGTFDEPK